jgi:hypothetical protein
MRKKLTIILILTGITLIVIGLILDIKMHPYQSLRFPFDIITIGLIVTGFVLLTGILTIRLDSKILLKTILILYPTIILLSFGLQLLLSTKFGTTTYDLFLNIYRWTYLISILVFILQLLNLKLTGRIILILLLLTGLFWTIIHIYELTSFLNMRQGSVEYAEEPKSIWTYTFLLYLTATWTFLTFTKLIRIKKNAW